MVRSSSARLDPLLSGRRRSTLQPSSALLGLTKIVDWSSLVAKPHLFRAARLLVCPIGVYSVCPAPVVIVPRIRRKNEPQRGSQNHTAHRCLST
jgi:hypothetical protein